MPFDGSQLDDVTKLLIEGRERIERVWCQNSYTTPDGAVCALGAIRFFDWPTRERPLAYRTLNRLKRAIGKHIDVPRWNDAPERTKDEVLAAFDRAIAQTT